MNTIVAIIYFLGAIAAGAVVLMLGLPAIAGNDPRSRVD